MFNVVTLVIATVLLILVGIAGLTFLGPMFTDNHAREELATYLNQGAQIHGALHLFQAQNAGDSPAGTGTQQVQALVDAGYLKEVPNSAWSIDTALVFRDIKTASECVKLNSAAKMDLSSPVIASYGGCPPCADAQFSSYPACTRPDGTAAAQAPGG